MCNDYIPWVILNELCVVELNDFDFVRNGHLTNLEQIILRKISNFKI